MKQMSNDFKSLLSNFRLATNTASNSPHVEPSNPTSSSSSIEDSISQLWRVSRLRGEMLHRTVQRTENKNVQPDDRIVHFHLAICVCIIDSLVHEPLWREFMGGVVSTHFQTNSWTLSTSAEMYIHAKYPERIKSPWVRYVI